MDNSQELVLAANAVDARRKSLELKIQTLVHACKCSGHSDECGMFSKCFKWKRIIAHTKICTRKVTGDCSICTQLISLCVYHARNCPSNNCLVPFCYLIKKKLQRRQLQTLIAKDQRSQVADLLFDTVSSNILHSVIFGQEISDEMAYAKKVESDIFDQAYTVADYYRLLGAKKWEIEMDIEKSQRNFEEHL